MFYIDEIGGEKVLKSSLIDDKSILAFFTLRNTNIDKLFCSDIFKKTKYVIQPEQTHSDNIEIADSRTEYPNTDGLIVTQSDKPVCLKFADCTPLIFYDKEHNIGAAAHAGWRGTAAKIGIKTLKKMSDEFGSKPENITVLIGAAIGGCCYEVSEEVKNKLLSTVKNTTGLSDGKKVDLKKINARQLNEYGISSIDICPFCTSCNNDMFYSYRKENGTDKRHFAIFMIS